MNNDFREDSVRVRFPEPSQDLSRRMDALFEKEEQRCLSSHKRRRHFFRPIAYAAACSVLLAIVIGAGWFRPKQNQQDYRNESTTGTERPATASVEYSAPEALVFVKSERPKSVLDFSDVIGPISSDERVTRRTVLHWPVQ